MSGTCAGMVHQEEAGKRQLQAVVLRQVCGQVWVVVKNGWVTVTDLEKD